MHESRLISALSMRCQISGGRRGRVALKGMTGCSSVRRAATVLPLLTSGERRGQGATIILRGAVELFKINWPSCRLPGLSLRKDINSGFGKRGGFVPIAGGRGERMVRSLGISNLN